MATTAMDYENANGDRFDGESRIPPPACSDTRLLSPHTQSRCRQSISPPSKEHEH